MKDKENHWIEKALRYTYYCPLTKGIRTTNIPEYSIEHAPDPDSLGTGNPQSALPRSVKTCKTYLFHQDDGLLLRP